MLKWILIVAAWIGVCLIMCRILGMNSEQERRLERKIKKMSLNSSKILYAFLALVIGLTVGVVVAVIVGVVVTLQCFVRFPLQLYAICVDNEKTRRLTGAFGTQSKKDLRRQEERTALNWRFQ